MNFLLKQNNIAVLARGVLAQGLLVNKPAKEYLNHNKEEIETARKTILTLSGPHRIPAQTAIQYVLNQSAVASAVIGIRNREQLKEATFTSPSLKDEEIQTIFQLIRPGVYEQHR